MECDSFQNFWVSKKAVVLDALPKECLVQVVTDESDKKVIGVELYRQQRSLFVALAKAIATVQGVLVDITWGLKGAEDSIFEGGYSRRPNSFFKIGDTWVAIELRTKGDDHKGVTSFDVALHRIVVTNASKISPRSKMKDGYYGCVKLTTRAGYWVSDEYFPGMLGDGAGTAFPVTIEGANRPAMLVKDAGDSLSKQLFSREFAPADVYEMSKQLYEALEASGTKGVIHGDVCLENICCKGGGYSLIDWGLACDRPFSSLVSAVNKAWPGLDVMPKIPNWEMSPDCYFCEGRSSNVVHDQESLLNCCLKILGGNTLPWSSAADEFEVLQLRTASMRSLTEEHGRHLYLPLLCKLRGIVLGAQ
ncbi:hypothetical protein SELMODRAFT_403342 [Selaginella moellendorffii]|uniref:Aminoglycoside phosphotransferase domain-containing protein n=1 Tax=Selaginella moellendorffii TaxID=88036 RepID=D8QTV4_SELML|nr:hypothetical protein SELMODRAFT_403342 [Selaginella moellendorffii]